MNLHEIKDKICDLQKRYEAIIQKMEKKELEKLKELENSFKVHFEEKGFYIEYKENTMWAQKDHEKFFFYDYNDIVGERYKVITHMYENGEYPGCKFELGIDFTDYHIYEDDLPVVNNVSLQHKGLGESKYLRLFDDVDKFLKLIYPQCFKELESELKKWEEKISAAEKAYERDVVYITFNNNKILNSLEDILNEIE